MTTSNDASTRSASYQWTDLSRHTTFLSLLLLLDIGLAAISVFSQFDAVFLIAVAISYVLIAITTMFAFGYWIVRACRNAHVLADRNLRFSPGWSLGWYFIPIANLWKPYQAMRQIWNVSENPSYNENRSAPAVIKLWWFAWIVSSFTWQTYPDEFNTLETFQQLAEIDIVSIGGFAVETFATVLALVVVRSIDRMQKAVRLSTAYN